jgi:hypothetical protein
MHRVRRTHVDSFRFRYILAVLACLPLPFLAVACGQPNSGTTPDVNDQSLRPTRVPPTHDNAVRAPAVAASRETGSPLNIIPTSLAATNSEPSAGARPASPKTSRVPSSGRSTPQRSSPSSRADT